jgi:SAM-dependent methyltransferase
MIWEGEKVQTNEKIDEGKAFDWGLVSEDYAKYRDIYPKEFYRKILELGCCTKGQKVLDMGTGTGVLPRNLYEYGASFIGTDISENQILFARQLSQKAGMNIEYLISSAENLQFPDDTFDVVMACQCFMYFDPIVIFPKVFQMLKEDGHFLIMFMSWLPDESVIAEKSEEIVLKYNPAWSGKGMKRYEPSVPKEAIPYFKVSHNIAFDIDIPFNRENWHGRIKACRGIGASSLSSDEIAAWEEEHLRFLETVPETFMIPHYATILDLQKKIL